MYQRVSNSLFSVLLMSVVLLSISTSIRVNALPQLPPQEFNAAVWIIQRYGLVANMTYPCLSNTTFATITCGISGSNYTIQKIVINRPSGSNFNNNGAPQSLSKLTLPGLTSISINNNYYQFTDNINILDMLDAPIVQSIEMFGDSSIISVPLTIPGPLTTYLTLQDPATFQVNVTRILQSNLKYFCIFYNQATLSDLVLDMTQTYPNIRDMFLSLYRPSILIQQSTFPNLNSLRIISVHYQPINFTLTATSPVLTSLDVHMSNNYTVVDISAIPQLSKISVQNIMGPGAITNSVDILPSDMSSFVNMTTLEYDQVGAVTFPSVFPPNLDTIVMENMGLSNFPNIPNSLYPKLKMLNLNTNSLSGTIPTNLGVGGTMYLDLSSNSGINGGVPTTFCNFRGFNLMGTTINSLPTCVLCYFNILNSTQTIKVPMGTQQSCTPTITVTSFTTPTPTVTITGTNLGWAVNGDSSPGLRALTPNTEFEYTIDTTNPTDNLIFSNNVNVKFQVTWVPNIIISTVTLSQKDQKLILVVVEGTLSNTIPQFISIGSSVNATLVYQPNGYFTALIPYESGLESSSLAFSIQNGYFTKQSTTSFKLTFPFVNIAQNTADGSTNIMVGSNVVMYGTFNNTNPSQTDVYIDKVKATVSSITSTSITLVVPQVSTIGVVNVTIVDSGYTFYSSSIMSISPTPVDAVAQCIKDTNNCNGHGNCTADQGCVCNSPYTGSNCNYVPTNNTYVGSNTTTSASFEVDGYTFSFELVGIQEVDIDDSIIGEPLLTNIWTVSNTTNSTMVNMTYTLSNQPTSNLTVQSNIIYTTNAMQYTFAGQQVNLPPKSIKLGLSITNWTYQSHLSTIQAIFKTKIDPNAKDSCGRPIAQTFIQRGNLVSLNVQKNGVTFYGSFSNRVVVDGRDTLSINRVLNQSADGTIYITSNFPQCKSCQLDPNLSTLIQVDDGDQGAGCGDSNSKNTFETWKIITIVVVVGGSIIIAALIITLRVTSVRHLIMRMRLGKTKKGGIKMTKG